MPVSLRIDEFTAILTLESDDGLNRLSRHFLRELAEHLHTCAENSSVRGIVIAATGRAFSAGADIEEFPYGRDADEFLHEMLTLISTPERIPKPVVAAVERSAIAGGFELALACDWIVAHPEARLGLAEVKFGFMPGYCMSRLPYLVGEARARRLLLDPGPFRPKELAALGIHISESSEGKDAIGGAIEMCRRMEVGAPSSIRLVKGLTNRFVRNPDFDAVIAAYNFLFLHPASHEGLNAFRENRSPDFWSGQ
jgi:enoyl-CoA hydratase/carnithine racemase